MNIETLSTDELKTEYVKLCTAAMIYGTNTENQRKQIAEEIEHRETKDTIKKLDSKVNDEYLNSEEYRLKAIPKDKITVKTLRRDESQPEKVEITSPSFSLGQKINVEYDLPRKGHEWRGYAELDEMKSGKALGLFEVTDIYLNMLVNPNFVMIELTSRDEKFDKIHSDSKVMLIDEAVILKRLKAIDEKMIIDGLKNKIIKLIDSPHGDGVVCSIGDNWFYFGGEEAERSTVEEYKKNIPHDVIVKDIYNTLTGFEGETDFNDEYLYYYAHLCERLKEFGVKNSVDLSIYKIDSSKLIKIGEKGYQPGQEQAKIYFDTIPQNEEFEIKILNEKMQEEIAEMLNINVKTKEGILLSVDNRDSVRVAMTAYYISSKSNSAQHFVVSYANTDKGSYYVLANKILNNIENSLQPQINKTSENGEKSVDNVISYATQVLEKTDKDIVNKNKIETEKEM